MNPSSSYVRRPQGVPMVYVLVAVVSALLVGMLIGKSGAAPAPVAVQADGVDAAPSDGTLYDPKSGSLKECRSQNRELLAALGRAGGDSGRYADSSDSSDDSDSYEGTRGDSRAFGHRTSSGGTGKKEAEKEEPTRQPANIRVWASRAQKLSNRPDVLTSGSVYNRESVSVDGILHVTLLAVDGTPINDASFPLSVQPGRSQWEHVFRWVPDEKNARYTARVSWETLTY